MYMNNISLIENYILHWLTNNAALTIYYINIMKKRIVQEKIYETIISPKSK